MPKSPNKYGLKMFALGDTKTRYTVHLEPYVSKQPERPFYEENDASNIVLRLIEPIYGTSRISFMIIGLLVSLYWMNFFNIIEPPV